MIEIFTGSLIEHHSERAVLERIVDVLSREQRAAVILANFEVGGRQVDLVVTVDGFAMVVEAKFSSRPLRGKVNGSWEAELGAGGRKPIRNYYRQTLDVAHAVRDAMSDFAKGDVQYPRAALVFAPSLPKGSGQYGQAAQS